MKRKRLIDRHEFAARLAKRLNIALERAIELIAEFENEIIESANQGRVEVGSLGCFEEAFVDKRYLETLYGGKVIDLQKAKIFLFKADPSLIAGLNHE